MNWGNNEQVGISKISSAKTIVFTMLLASITFYLLPATAYAITPTMYVDPPSVVDPDLTLGSTFTVNVNVTDIIDLHSWQVYMDWTPGLIDALTVTYGDFISSQKDTFPAPPYINNTEGVCVFGEITLGTEGTDGSGWLGTVEFEVKGTGATDINIDDPEFTYLLDSTWPDPNEILFTPQNGYFSNEAAPTPDFSLSASPDALTIEQGSSGTSTITVTATGGFSSAVALSVTAGLPTGVTAAFVPTSVTPPGTTTSVLTLTASATATLGTVALTITGTSTSPALTHTTTISLTVSTAPPIPDFSLSASPNTLTIQQGSSSTSTITVTSMNTFDSPVSLTASGLPTDVTVSFSPNMVTPPAGSSTTSTLTFAAGASATLGTVTVTITGTSTTPSLTNSTTISLTINGPHLPQYDLTLSVVGSGTTDPAPGVYTYDEGTVVSVDAIPDAGWLFDRWKLDGVDVGLADSYSITVDADHTLTAVFSETVSDLTNPVANAGQDQTVDVGATVTFDAGASSDNIGIVSYDWAFGDGATGTGKTTTHTYTNPGTYTVTLTVKDAANNSATHTITVTVLPAPQPAEVFPIWVVGVALAVIGAAVVATLLLRRRK